VNKLQKMVKSPIVNGSVNLSMEDKSFFRKMIGNSPRRRKRTL